MDLVTALFSIARDITTGDLDEVNKLHDKAKQQVSTYHTESKNKMARMYAKLHKGWLFQLGLIFAVPFITTYFLKMKMNVMNEEGSNDDYEDEDEREHFEYLKNKYGSDYE